MFRSLRLRIALSHAAVLAAIILTLGGAGQALLAANLDREATREVTVAARQAVERIKEDGVAESPPDTDNPSRVATRVVVFSPGGTPVEAGGKVPGWLLPRERPVVDATVAGQDVRIVTRTVRAGGHRVAVVVAALSLAQEQSLVHRVRMLLLFGGLAAVAVSMLAGWWLSGRAVRPIRRAYDVQSHFAADASHELRTPLTFIRAGVEAMAERDPALGGEVLGEVHHMTQLIERLLLLARADSGSVPVRLERVDLGEACRSAARRGREAHGLELTMPSGEAPLVTADQVATEAALDALLENVAYHGGRRAEVQWGAEEGTVTLGIVDHGDGMPIDVAQHAFERFFRADPARGREGGGAGLGLSIARALISAQGGSLSLHPTPGGGLTARMTFRQAAPGAGMEESSREPVVDGARRARVLSGRRSAGPARTNRS